MVTTEGANQSVTGTAQDVAGNRGEGTVSAINIDKTLPEVAFQALVPAANANGWNNADVTVGYALSDPLSGIEGDESGSVSFTTEGASQTRSVTAKDKAGNTATVTPQPVNIDKTPPSVSGTRTPEANANGWYNTDVTVSFLCSDILSGMAFCPGSTTLTAEGADQSVTGAAQDLADNRAESAVGGIHIDKTAPSTLHTLTGTRLKNGAYKGSVTVSLDAADSLSGVAAIRYRTTGAQVTSSTAYTGPFKITTTGTTTVYYAATDRAGNVEAERSFTVKVVK